MSKEMPYYSIDKVAATVSIDAKARAKWDARAAADPKKRKVTTLMALFLEEAVRDDPFTLEMKRKADEYMDRNAERREIRKARKGIK